MSRLPRILIGQRGNDIGFWVSAPNKNVLTAGEDDLHVSPRADRQSLTFLTKAIQEIRANKESFFPYEERISQEPLVITQPAKRDGRTDLMVAYIPGEQEDMGRLGIGTPPRFKIKPEKDGLRVVNLKNNTYRLQYLVLAIPVK